MTHTLLPAEAARWLNLDEGAIASLVQAGYLTAVNGAVPLAEVKAFQARNADGGSGTGVVDLAEEPTDPKVLLDALSSKTEELAVEAYHRFVREIPDARSWSEAQRDMFIQQAQGRFTAILAVTSHGAEVDQALRRDLEVVGGNAAWANSSLPHLLLVLRISRDLLLQSAMRLAYNREGRLDASLAALAARMLPAIDRLTDALSDGYWAARLDKQRADWQRLSGLLQRVPYGIYETDMDGIVRYNNPALAAMVGSPDESLEGRALTDIFNPIEGSGTVSALLSEPEDDAGQVSFSIEGPENEAILLDVDTVVRRNGDDIVGFGGIVRRVVVGQVQPDSSVLTRHIEELRRSLAILVEAGDFLARHAEQMQGAQVVQAGESIRRQGERLQIIVDELDADRVSNGL